MQAKIMQAINLKVYGLPWVNFSERIHGFTFASNHLHEKTLRTSFSRNRALRSKL